MLVLLVAQADVALAQGWQPEQYWYGGGAPTPEGACARFPGSTTTICVFEYGPNPFDLNLVEMRSTDGGLSWTSPVAITTDSAAEFDPFLAIDNVRGRLSLLYSKNAPPGNDLLVRHLACLSCSWSGSVNVIANGQNHWDASLVALSNGHLLALDTTETLEGAPDGKIWSIRSTDGGATWGSPTAILDEAGNAETYPVAVQKIDGVIHLMFRDKNHGGGNQIGQLWSSDQGYSWTGHSVFSYSPSTSREFSFIGSQGGYNLTVLASIVAA